MSGIMSTTLVFTLLSFFVSHVSSLASTDTITWGGDNSRSGYQTNHNMDPSVVGSSQFGLLFKTLLPGNYNGAPEQIYSQPLVYTPSDGIQYVYVATTQNNVYKINAKTGAIVLSRNLHIPFLTADLNGCVDINPHIGVIGTGVIDPDTDTLYFFAKTYANQTGGNGAQGKPNGRHYLHAVNVNDLTEQPNFPVNLEGIVARNSPTRSFNGGIHNQRPALIHTGQYIYAGFGSHCVQYNFTGWIMGFDKTTGANVERWATEGVGVSNTLPGGGVWMSGGGIASDDAGSLFFGTGNGYASQLSTIPVNGRNPPTAMEEAAVHMTINSDGSLTTVDFFMPYEKTQLDGADKDLGCTPLELLPSQFSCGDYKRIGVITGKTGKTYFLNMDDLGGYQNGPNKLDKIIGVYQNENSVYAGAGVYPGEGGYIYINVIQYATHVFQFSCNAGVPGFTKVADTANKNAYVLGTGHGTTTSLNGQTGTGLYWVTDVDGLNLRVYNAVPANGVLTQIAGFNIPGVTKFSRPVFGDSRAYVGTNVGYLYAFGSPVNLPLNCTSPVNFGTSNLNTATAATTITCLANVGVTVTNLNLTGNANFNMTGAPATPLTVAAGKTFSFQAYFNPQTVGPLSSDIVITTTNNVAGYSVNTPVTLRGTGQSVSALLQVSPVVLSFQGVVTGAQVGGVNQSVLINNLGNAPLTISTVKYSLTSETGPFVSANQTSSGPRAGAFTFIGLPTTIPGNSGVTAIVNFDTSVSGNFAAYLNIVSDGGTKIFDVVGTSGSAPVAVLEFQTTDGSGWVQYQAGQNFTFGNVTENTTRSLKMRITNNATTDGANLHVTVSKPPFGVAGLIGAANSVDLAEGTDLAPGASATASLYCSVPKQQWNNDPYSGSAVWTLNVDDPTFGKHIIPFSCNAVSEQAPPLTSNGLGLYRYTGCFKENNPGRQLKQQLYSDPANVISECVAACAAANWIFCAVQYNRECWGGNSIPIQQVDESNCNYPCAGDVNQVCGGNGVGSNAGGSYMSLFADGSRFNGNVSSITPTGPFVNPGVNGYNSIGCYTEGTNTRALTVGMNTKATVAACVNACGAGSYTYAGLEYGGECWCGNSFGTGSVQAPLTDCSMTCNDNTTEYCGAGSRLNVYQKNGTYISLSSSVASSTAAGSTTVPVTTPTATSGPQIKKVVKNNWTFQGCYTEATNARALANITYASDAMTLESCATFCQGNLMMAVEYSRECYCANKLSTGSIPATNQADCSMTCKGDATEYCGSGNRLQLYSYTPSNSSSISSSAQSSTTSVVSSSSSSTRLTTSSLSSSSSSLSSAFSSSSSSSGLPSSTSISSSIQSSTSTLTSSSFSSSSALSSTSSVLSSSSTSTPSSSQSSSSSSFLSSSSASISSSQAGTTSSSSSTSGASTTSSSLSSTSSSSQSSSSSSVSSSASSSSSQAATTSSSSSASGTSTTSSFLSSTSSLSFQTSSSSSQAGTTSSSSSSSSTSTTSSSLSSTSSSSQSSSSSSVTSSSFQAGTTSSSSSTSGTSTISLSLSSTSSSTSSSATPIQTVPAIVPTIGAYTYKGCYTEATNQRALSAASFYNYTSMTLEMCAASCSGAKSWGVEYSGECYCGSSLNAGSVIAPDTDCSFICPGNKLEFCGAGNRLSVYTLSANSALGSAPSSTLSTSTAQSTAAAAPTPTVPVISQGNSNFTYYGCVSEPSAGRLLAAQVENNGTYMSIEKCLANCPSSAYVAVEYGRECWCGNTLNFAGNNGATPGKNVSDSDCSFLCPGNSTEYCGAGNRLSVYYFDAQKALRNSGK